jgi:hypothetical protein
MTQGAIEHTRCRKKWPGPDEWTIVVAEGTKRLDVIATTSPPVIHPDGNEPR